MNRSAFELDVLLDVLNDLTETGVLYLAWFIVQLDVGGWKR